MQGILKMNPPLNEPVSSYAVGSSERAAISKSLLDLRAAERMVRVSKNLSNYVQGTVDICEPHDHQRVLAKGEEIHAEGVKVAIRNVVAAQKEWNATPWEQRTAIFERAADRLASPLGRATMNGLTMLAQSKTVHQAEIDATCELVDFFRFNNYFFKQILSEQPLSVPGVRNHLEYRGLEGFVFAVGPFNFSSISVNLATAPALMGCTVLWKPSHGAYAASSYALDVLHEAGLPEGVIQLVMGDAAMIGKEALASPDLAGIHFTGSTPTFRKLWKETSQNLEIYKNFPRIVGETGGKDFIIAHRSADPEALFTAIVRGAYEYQGQKCSAASRAYIPASLFEEHKDRWIETIEGLKQGSPVDFSNFLSAVIDERSFDRIAAAIDEAKSDSQNYQILAGGTYSKEKGYFIRPTLILTKDPQSRLMCEELFGPVLTVYVYQDDEYEKILNLCDKSTSFALTGAVFANDRQAILQAQEALRYSAGNFYINDKPTGAVVGQQPFGGSRLSGTNDKAGSPFNLLRWTSPRTVKETFLAPVAYGYPFMEK